MFFSILFPLMIPQKINRYNVETNLWQEIRASGRAPPARSGAQVPLACGAANSRGD